jgi:hypothetical protein
VSTKIGDPDGCSCGLTMVSRLGQAFNEEAFRYLLGVQRKRSERSEQPFLLLLIDLESDPGLGSRIDPALARKLFSGMCRALRETDLVGWYSDERIAGAVLTKRSGEMWVDDGRIVAQRVTDALAKDLPSPAARRVRVHAHHIQPSLVRSS